MEKVFCLYFQSKQKGKTNLILQPLKYEKKKFFTVILCVFFVKQKKIIDLPRMIFLFGVFLFFLVMAGKSLWRPKCEFFMNID